MVRRSIWKREENPRTQIMIVRKFGNWDIGFIRYGDDPKTFLMVRGEWYGENPIIYQGSYDVAYDRPYEIPDSVRKWLRKNSKDMFILQRQLNREAGSSYLNSGRWA